MSVIKINGQAQPWEKENTLAKCLQQHLQTTGPIAVALNRKVISREKFEQTLVYAGDEIDILVAMQGG